jgi:Family of unknown function (DUF6455)
MLTYDDCLGLSGLTQEEVAALARIRHLPEIIALEMGWGLCGTPEGRRAIRRMILVEIEEACRRGDARAAAGLGLVLHHFLEGHCAQDRPVASPPAGGDGGALMRALRLDPAAAPRLRERLDGHLAAMLRRFGLDRASVRERFPTEAQVAEMCCATCAETGRCARFLAGATGAEAPSAFCPNAPLFGELGRHGSGSRDVA